MTREEYYRQFEKAMKASCKLPLVVEVNTDKYGWVPLNLYDGDDITLNSEYRIKYHIGSVNNIISERAFDKCYLPMIKYSNRADVSYRDSDITVTVYNVRYIILDQFQKYFLQPYEN